MGNGVITAGAGHAVHPGRLAGFGNTFGALAGSAKMVVPFVIQIDVPTGSTTFTVIPVSSGLPSFRIVDAWGVASTLDADADWNVRSGSGDAGGTLIVTIRPSSADTRLIPIAVDGTISSEPYDWISSATVGLFLDYSAAANTGVGTVYLLCYRI